MTRWFMGDAHLFHEKVSYIRGFETVMDHNWAILSMIEKTVHRDDIVTFVGDNSGGNYKQERKALELLEMIDCRKELVAGNHDSISGVHRKLSPNTDLFRRVFGRINDSSRIRLAGTEFLISHFPYASQGDGPGRGEPRHLDFRLPDRGKPLIHAHTHHTDPFNGSVTGREMCVSWDAWKRLVGIEDILEWHERIKDA